MPTIRYTHFPSLAPDAYPLGRHQELDSRSLNYRAPRAETLKSVQWTRALDALEQWRIGACTGFAAAGALITEPYVNQLGLNTLTVDEANIWGFSFYSGASTRDQFVGNFPPNDDGSSGLGICRHLKQLGIITGYHWGTTSHALASMIQSAPVLLGMPWLEAFFEPDRGEFIDADGWEKSSLAGGHEIEILGIHIDEDDLNNSVLECVNSWGTGWGDRGRFRMRMSTYVALRDGCDIKQFII
jgi:hypothetical protein